MRPPESTVGRLGLLAVLWLLLIAVFWSLTTAADLVPDDRIAGTLVASAQSGDWQPEGGRSEFGLVVDHYTDCVALTQGLGERVPPVSRLAQAVSDVTLAPEGCAGVIDRLAGVLSGQVVEGTPHFRYWHGYVLLTRPLLAWTDMATLRVALAVLLAGSLAAFAVSLVRVVGGLAASAFLVPLILTSDLVALPISTVHSIAWSVIMLGGAAGVWATSRWGTWGAATAALVAGSTYVFVDLLTTPPAAVMVFLAGVLAAGAGQGAAIARSVRTAVIGGLVWGLGYAATWVAKWAISAAVFGVDAVANEIRSMVAFRLSGSNAAVENRFGAATQANWSTWMQLDSLVAVVALSCLVVGGYAVVWIARRRSACLAWSATFAAVSVIPFLWYEVVSNHSQIHAWFTFRSLPVSLGTLMLGLAVAARCSRLSEVPEPSEEPGVQEDDLGRIGREAVDPPVAAGEASLVGRAT